jgi:uncharacterized protein (DUF1778 family)
LPSQLEEAAESTRQSTSSSVLEASVAAAEKVLGRNDVTMLPAEQFDQLVATLDIPDDAPELAKPASRPRRYIRR